MRRYYFSGMFSLILIPLMIYWYVDEELERKADGKYCVEIALCRKKTENSCKSCFNCFTPIRNYTRFHLNGHKLNDINVIKRVDEMAKLIYDREDTINGIKVVLDDSSNYESLIKLNDIFLKRKIDRYLFFDNQFIVIYDFDKLTIGKTTFKAKRIDETHYLIHDVFADNIVEIQTKRFCAVLRDPPSEDMLKQERQRRLFLMAEVVKRNAWYFSLLSVFYLLMVGLTIRDIIQRINNQELKTKMH